MDGMRRLGQRFQVRMPPQRWRHQGQQPLALAIERMECESPPLHHQLHRGIDEPDVPARIAVRHLVVADEQRPLPAVDFRPYAVQGGGMADGCLGAGSGDTARGGKADRAHEPTSLGLACNATRGAPSMARPGGAPGRGDWNKKVQQKSRETCSRRGAASRLENCDGF